MAIILAYQRDLRGKACAADGMPSVAAELDAGGIGADADIILLPISRTGRLTAPVRTRASRRRKPAKPAPACEAAKPSLR